MTSTSGRTAPQPQRNSQHHTVYTVYMCTAYKTVFPLCTEYFLIQYKRDGVGTLCGGAWSRGSDRSSQLTTPTQQQHNNTTIRRQHQRTHINNQQHHTTSKRHQTTTTHNAQRRRHELWCENNVCERASYGHDKTQGRESTRQNNTTNAPAAMN